MMTRRREWGSVLGMGDGERIEEREWDVGMGMASGERGCVSVMPASVEPSSRTPASGRGLVMRLRALRGSMPYRSRSAASVMRAGIAVFGALVATAALSAGAAAQDAAHPGKPVYD